MTLNGEVQPEMGKGKIMNARIPEYEIMPEILARWSRRAMSDEPLERDDLMKLFEAARWAPSSYNGQPWRYIYAFRGSTAWAKMYDLLDDLNRQWCDKAGALIILVSRTQFELNENPDISFALNAGASWENLALQGTSMGLAVRGMQDFDYHKAVDSFSIPPVYKVQMMIAVGHPGDPSNLPDRLQEREGPTQRKAISEIAFENEFLESAK